MKKILVLILAVLMTVMAAAAAAETTVAVTGTGEVRISADTAVLSLGVSTRDKEVLKAQQKVNTAIAAIRKALAESGVKEEDINTEYISIYAIYDYQEDMEQVEAYSASSTLSIRITDMENVGMLIDTAFANGANTFNGISFSASDPEEAKAEAMKKAVENARKKAEILAEATGLRITGIEQITEGGIYSYEKSAVNLDAGRMDLAEEAELDDATVVQAAKLVISATVSINFTAEKAE